jgi:hypothetical protein
VGARRKGGHGGGGTAAREQDNGVGSAGGGRRPEWPRGPNMPTCRLAGWAKRAGSAVREAEAQWEGGGQRAGWAKGGVGR